MDAAQSPAPTVNATADAASRFYAVFFYVSPAIFLGTLDQTIVAAALPAIAARLHDFANIAWIVTAYLLAATVSAPIHGRLGDAFGRRRALLWAVVLFIIGSLACAVAPTLPLLVAARALQGLGGGGLMTLALALLGEAVSPKERGRFQGWFGAVFALASAIGPVAGGLLAEHWGWRSIFWINVPLGAVSGACVSRLMAKPGTGGFRFDAAGTASFAVATVALLLALSLGPTTGWGTPAVLAMVLVAMLGLTLLWRIEHWVADPLISPDLLTDPVVWRAAVCVLLFAVLFFAAVVQLPLFVQLTLGMSPSLSGLLLIPLTLAQVAVSTVTGYRISMTGHPRNSMAAGLAVSAGGFLLMTLGMGLGPWMICLASAIFGLGLGTTMPAAQTLAQWAAGGKRLGAAIAIVTFTRSIGGVMGAASTAAILMAVLQVVAPDLIPQIQATLEASSVSVSLRAATIAHVATAFRWVFAGLTVIAAAAAAIAWSVPDIDLANLPEHRRPVA